MGARVFRHGHGGRFRGALFYLQNPFLAIRTW